VKTPLSLISFCIVLTLIFSLPTLAEERNVSHRVEPVYPEVMKKMHMGGTVKVRVVIAPDGRVVEAQSLGGHPMLIESATDAVKKWKFESGPGTTTMIIEIKFDPSR
jgi:TonB family protein